MMVFMTNTNTTKVALVTGASRGIGLAIATLLAHQGYQVIGTATSYNGAAKIDEYLKAIHRNCTGMCLNVTDPHSITELCDAIKDQFGVPTVLVNNAGITCDNLMIRMSDEEWDRVLDTNLKAIFRLSKAVLRGMMKARWGRIVTIGSVVGTTGNPGQANYCAAKAGLIGFSKALAKEVASRNITVNVVAPGFIDTDMTHSLDDTVKQTLLGAVPLGRLGRPEDIAHAVGYLVSDGASYVTGETIHVNGGMSMA